MKYCPNCDSLLNADMEVYVIDGEVVGCEECCTPRYADEYFNEDELSEQDYIDNALWEQGEDRRIERVIGHE